MAIIQQISFALVTTVAIWFFSRKVRVIRRNILLGRDEAVDGDPAQRWRNLLLLAFGQKNDRAYMQLAWIPISLWSLEEKSSFGSIISRR